MVGVGATRSPLGPFGEGYVAPDVGPGHRISGLVPPKNDWAKFRFTVIQSHPSVTSDIQLGDGSTIVVIEEGCDPVYERRVISMEEKELVQSLVKLLHARAARRWHSGLGQK